MFLTLADLWKLAVDLRRALLSDISRPTYHNWQGGKIGTLSRDQLERISLVLGIHKGLTLLFADEASATRWFASPNRDLPFGGRSGRGRSLFFHYCSVGPGCCRALILPVVGLLL
jgi:hypothetical protein